MMLATKPSAPRNATEFFDDYYGAVDANRSRVVSAGGGSTSVSTATSPDRVGIVTLITSGTGNSAFVGSATLTVWDLTCGAIEVESNMMIETLSDASNVQTVRNGLIDSTSGVPTDGYFLHYLYSDNSGKFQLLIRRGGSTVGTLNTPTTVVAGTWYAYRMRINPITGRADLDINGSYQGSVVPSSVLTTTHQMGHGANVSRSGAGTDTLNTYVDYHRVRQLLDR